MAFPGRTARRLPAFTLAAFAATVGCSTPPITTPSREVVERGGWLNASQPTPDAYPNTDQLVIRGLADALGINAGPVPPQPAATGKPLEILVLSGGGKFTAFAAGVMVGWTATGTRPQFDVVTGISSGAISAVFLFLGPQYDTKIQSYFTTLRAEDLFLIRPVRGVLCWKALASSEPLRKIIDREVTPEIVEGLRQGHAQGRRLFVATNNLMTHRLTIWDLGALASSGRPDTCELVRKVILAACSAQGFVPPVEIDVTVNGTRYQELHGDAGNLSQGFVRTTAGVPPGSNIYAICSGYLYSPPRTDRPRFLQLITRGISDSLDAVFRANLMELYALCAVTHSHFHMISMPTTLTIPWGSMGFDPGQQKEMFQVGYQIGVAGPIWRVTPPESLPGELVRPRTGLEFVAP